MIWRNKHMSACLLIQTTYSRTTRTQRRIVHLQKVTIHYVWLDRKLWLGHREAADNSRWWSGWHRSDWRSGTTLHLQPSWISEHVFVKVLLQSVRVWRRVWWRAQRRGDTESSKLLARLPHTDLFLLQVAFTAFKRTLSSLGGELSSLEWTPNAWSEFLNVTSVSQYHHFIIRHIVCVITANWLLTHLHSHLDYLLNW